MEHLSLKNVLRLFFISLLLINIKYANAQRIYAGSQTTGKSGLLCLNCKVVNAGDAADGNLQTNSTLQVALGLAASTYQTLIFSGTKPAAGTPVTVKLGSGDKLLSLTALGGITLQAYNGSNPIGTPAAVNTLITALSNNNQVEVSIAPQSVYDRVRITLNGGLIGALANLYVYEAFYSSGISPVCNEAIDELHGISAGLLNLGADVGGVQSPQLAMDDDLTTASTLNAGVGLVGAYTQQTIIYSKPSVLGDSVRLTLSVPQSLVTAGIISNISVTTYNGNVDNNDRQSISSSLIRITVLDLGNNRQKFTVTFAPTKVFDRVQLTLGGIANVLSTLNFYEAQRLIPRPVIKVNNVVTDSTQVCSGSSATLAATPVDNTTFKWYTVETGGSPIFTGASFSTGALTASRTYYVAAVRNGCTDESERTKITITVIPTPSAPVVVDTNISVCSGQQATFTTSSITGVTVNWYSSATGGTLLHTGNTYTTGAVTATTSYYAEAVAGEGCTGAQRTQVTATVVPAPATPALVESGVSVCPGNAGTLEVSNPQSGVTYNWYSLTSGGTLLFTGTSYTSPVLNATTSYYVEGVNATGCTSAQRTQGTITVVPVPSDPVLAANNTTIAAGQTATIGITNAQTGVIYNWYTSPTAGAPVFTGTTYTTPALFSPTTYYVGAVNSTGCTSANRTPVNINVLIDNDAPCSFANQQSSNVNGICLGCAVNNAALATDADTTTASSLNVLAGLVGGYAEQQLQFQQGGFAGDTIKLVLQNPSGLLSASLLGQTTVTFYNGTTRGASYALNNNLLSVNLLSGPGDKYAVYIPATGAYDRITVRLSGVLTAISMLNIYYASQQFPQPVFNPVTPEICKGSTAVINITSPANGTFTWYTVPTGGTSIHTGATYTTPALTANTTYYVSYSRGSCAGASRFPIQVLVDDVPAAPVIISQNVSVISGHAATLNATSSNGATVQWFTAASGGTPVATGNTYITDPLNTDATFYAGTALGDCVSVSRVPVQVTVIPVVIPDVMVTPAEITVNPGESTTFTATSTTAGAVFNWYNVPTGGTPIFTGPSYTTPAEFNNTTYYAEASVPSTGAVSATRASGMVTVNQQGSSPVPCDAAIAQDNGTSGLLCVGCSVSNAGGSVDNDRNTFARLNVPIGLVNAYARQTLRFANTGIAGDSVIIELGIPGSLASVGVLSQISIATYNGTTFNNDRFNVNGSLLNVSLLNGTSRFRVAFRAGSIFDRVEIRLNAALAGVFNGLNIYDAAQEVAAPVIGAGNTTVCAGTAATLTATATANATIRWYTSANGGTAVFTGATFTTPPLNTTTIYYAEASRTADGCTQAVRTPVTVTITPVPAAPVVANNTVTVCSGSAATFEVTPVAGVTYNWYSTSAGGTLLHTGNNFTTDVLSATTSYYVEARVSGACSSSTRTKVTANVISTPANAVVAPNSIQTCAGSPVVLTATSVQPGVTFNWYTAPAGGTPVFTGSQFTTPALTANTSYYVEVSAGDCVSPERTQADVIVNPLPVSPTVTVTPAGGQISSGQTAQLTATSATTNVKFNWYTAESGGTPVFTGATYVTPALTSNTTYYVEAVSNTTGCVSPVRTPVTVIVNAVFSTSCDFASTQTSSNSGVLCVGCNVATPDNAVDSDTTNFSRLNMPIGAVGYVAQKLIFGDNGDAGDTVRVKIGVPVSLATVGVLGQLQIGSFNGNTDNGDRISLNSSLIKIQILSGGQTAIVKFVPQAAFNSVEIRIAATLSLFNSLDIYYASKQVAAPQVTVKTVNICAGNKATFTVNNPQANITYKWYDASVGGTAVFTGNPFITDALTETHTYYVESSRTSNGCANPNRVGVTANVTPAPVTPVLAANTVEVCAGEQVILTVTNAGSATINWYDAPTGGTLLFTGISYAVSPIATTKYYAEATNGTCTSSARTAATVTVNPRPAAPAVESADVQVCAGSSAVLKVSQPVTGVNYDWFTVPAGGTSKFTGATYTTPAITQNTIYYVQATDANSGCSNNGNRTAVNVTITDQLAAPVLSATSTTVCSGGGASISVSNPVSGLLYKWYTANAGGTLVFTGTTFTLDSLTADVSYYVEASNSMGCVSATRTRTDIIVQPIPSAPQVQADAGSLNICSGTSTSLSIINPQTGVVYRWYDSPTGGTLLYTGSQFDTQPLTSTTSYYVEAAEAGNCNPSSRTKVTITVNALPGNPVLVDANVSVCSGSTATLKISSPQANITYQWFDSPAKTNKLFEGATYVTGPVTVNTAYYVLAVNASGCVSSNLTTAQVTVVTAPDAPVIANGNAVQTCSGTTVALSIANPQTGFTYNWYANATSQTPLFTGNSFTTPQLTADVTYYVDAVNRTGCVSVSRTAVNITVNPLPVAPVVTAQGGGNTSVCNGSTITLNATSTTANVTFNWYTQATGGTAVFTGASFTTPAITNVITYYVEAMSNTGGCASASRTAVQVTINNSTAPQPAVDAADLAICQNNTATIHISKPDSGTTYNWYNSATGNNPVYTGTAFTTPVLTTNTTYYVEAVNPQSCNPSARLVVNVVVRPLPGNPVLADADVPVCSGSTATLKISSPEANTTYQWFDSPAKANKLFEGTTYVTGPITANTTYYVSAVNASGCASSGLTTAQVTVTTAPDAPVIASGNTVQSCAGSRAVIAVANPEAGFTYNWYADATNGMPLFTGSSFTTPELTADATYYVDAVNGTGCGSSGRTTVTVNVNPLPVEPVVTAQGRNASVCPGNTITLNATSATTNVTFKWYTTATGGAPVFTGAKYTTAPITATTNYFVEAVSNSGNCVSATRASIQVTINSSTAAQPTVNHADLKVCQNNTATIHISDPDTATTYNWYTSATSDSPVYTGTAFTTPVLTANTTYYVEAVSRQSCNPSARLTVNVVIVPQPATPVVAAATVDVCKGSPATLAIQSPQAGIVYKWYDSALRTRLLFTGPSFTTPAVSENTAYYVDASNGSCSSSSVAKVTVNVASPPAAPLLVNGSETTCKGSQVTLEIANPQPGFSYSWYTSASGGTSVYTGISFTTPVLTANTTYYAETINGTGCSSASRTVVAITIQPAPSAPQVNAPGAAICPGTTASLSAVNDDASITIKWYASATGGTALASGNNFTTPALNANTTYYAEAVNNRGCVSATRRAVTVKVLQQLDAPAVTFSATPTSITFNWSPVSNATGYEYSIDNGLSFIATASLSFTVSNLQPLQTATIIVRATGGSDCQTSANSAAVTGTATNPIGDQVFVPNAFSPNGDGNNDIFLVYGNTLKNVSMFIYDQWGGMLFSSNRQSAGWDGSYKGKAQPVGVYVYYIEAELNDGQKIKRKGTINLLR